MTIQPIGSAGLCLYLTPDDLSPYGLTPDRLTLRQALLLTRRACREAGVDLAGPLEIEAYPECLGVLLFAHAPTGGRRWYTFDDLESVLSAAFALRYIDLKSALWWWEGKYWLSLPAHREEAEAVCAQFGALQPPDPLRSARLEEGGALIFPHHALRELRRHFLRLQS